MICQLHKNHQAIQQSAVWRVIANHEIVREISQGSKVLAQGSPWEGRDEKQLWSFLEDYHNVIFYGKEN